NVVGQHHLQRLDAGEALLEVLAVALDRSAERPAVHAVGANADRPAPAAGAEGKDFKETIEQSGPLLPLNQPFDLRPIVGELGSGEPLAEIAEGTLLESRVRLDGLETFRGLRQQVHVQPRESSSQEQPSRRQGTADRGQASSSTETAKGKASEIQ